MAGCLVGRLAVRDEKLQDIWHPVCQLSRVSTPCQSFESLNEVDASIGNEVEASELIAHSIIHEASELIAHSTMQASEFIAHSICVCCMCMFASMCVRVKRA